MKPAQFDWTGSEGAFRRPTNSQASATVYEAALTEA